MMSPQQAAGGEQTGTHNTTTALFPFSFVVYAHILAHIAAAVPIKQQNTLFGIRTALGL